MLNSAVPRHVLADLHRLVESEELGESFFGTAADRAHNESDAQAWHTLHQLEVQTNQGVRRFIHSNEVPVVTANRLAESTGSVTGSALTYLPWRLQLHSVRLATHRYLPAFLRLAAAFEDSIHRTFFEYVVNHELAIIDFTERALSSHRAPLDAVRRLLDTPLPLPDD